MRWTLHEHLPRLLEACAHVAADDAFVLLTAHTTGLPGGTLADMLAGAFRAPPGIEIVDLSLAAESGARLRLGVAIRWPGRAAAPRTRNAAP